MTSSSLQNAVDQAWPGFTAALKAALDAPGGKSYTALKGLFVVENLAATVESVERRGKWEPAGTGMRRFKTVPALGLTELMTDEAFTTDELINGKGFDAKHVAIATLLSQLCERAVAQAVSYVVRAMAADCSHLPGNTPRTPAGVIAEARAQLHLKDAALSVVAPPLVEDAVVKDLGTHLHGGSVVQAPLPQADRILIVAQQPDGSAWRQSLEFDLSWADVGGGASLRVMSRLVLDLVDYPCVQSEAPVLRDLPVPVVVVP
jgi:hypothetical protein